MKDKKNLNPDNRICYNIGLTNHLYEKVKKHIRILKNLENRSTTNQGWIMNAIQRKIEKNEKILATDTPQKKTLFVKIDPHTLEKITGQVEILKKYNGSYSKTRWLLEAIMDQLEEESEKAKELLKR